MKVQKKLKLGLAGLGATALTVSSVLMGGLAANAADSYVAPEQIAGHENPEEESDTYNYTQWHVGSTENPDAQLEDSFSFTDCGIVFGGVPSDEATIVQLMKGFPIDQRPAGDAALGVAESIEVEVVSGAVHIQLPFFDTDGEWLGTLRNATPFEEGTHTVTSDLEVVGTKGQSGSLSSSIAEGNQLLGVGIVGEPGSEVASLSFDGDTYYFGSTDCTPVVEEVVEEEPVEEQEPAAIAPTKPQRVETAAL